MTDACHGEPLAPAEPIITEPRTADVLQSFGQSQEYFRLL